MKLADVQFTKDGGIMVARVVGELDMSNADDIGSALIGATSNEAVGIVLDLEAVDYLDSAGIHLLYRIREQLRTRGQQLKVVVPVASPVNDALRLAGVKQHLDVSISVEEAMDALQHSRAEAS